MLACTAIQKLERYGQLALKRNSVENFVVTSLNDPKRANVYALTHLETWRECLRAVVPEREEALGMDATGAAVSPSPPVLVTDSLVYAISFTVALLSYHVQLTSLMTHTRGIPKSSTNPAPEAGPPPPIVFLGDDAASLAPAVGLFRLLKETTAGVVQQSGWTPPTFPSTAAGLAGGGGPHVRMHHTQAFTESWTHLLSNLVSFVFVLAVLQLRNGATRGAEVGQLYQDALVLLAAVFRQLRRCLSRSPPSLSGTAGAPNGLHALLQSRPCAMWVRQQVKKFTSRPKTASGSDDSRGAAAAACASFSASSGAGEGGGLPPLRCPTLRLLVAFLQAGVTEAQTGAQPLASVSGTLEKIPLFHKVALLYAMLREMPLTRAEGAGTPPSELKTTENSVAEAAAGAGLLSPLELQRREAAVQHLIRVLLAPTACNRATRYVVYYRGDDTKLLLNNVRESGEYALHTFATTPPTERGLVGELVQSLPLPPPSAERTEHAGTPTSSPGPPTWHHRAALHVAFTLAQWITSVPLFFESFCSDASWMAFAQEQRRLALQRNFHERSAAARGRAVNRKRGRAEGPKQTPPRSPERADEEGDRKGGDPLNPYDTQSLVSYASSLQPRSMRSLESRASVLSTLSRQSMESYRVFLSALPPVDKEAESDVAPARPDESTDGNTNLPLILLEELVLGLNGFLEQYPAGLLDTYGLRELCWGVMGQLFTFIQRTLARSSVTGLSAGLSEDTRGGNLCPLRSANATPLLPAASFEDVPEIFNLGLDIRYNQGLGYECLGLIFAKVLAPQLERNSSNNNNRRGVLQDEEAPVSSSWALTQEVGENAEQKKVVQEAVSRCLSAYEIVAPQVVDMKLPTVLRMVALSLAGEEAGSDLSSVLHGPMDDKKEPGMRPGTASQSSTGTTASARLLYNFFATVVQRLGRSNKLPFLLDALFTSSFSETAAKDLDPVTHPNYEAKQPREGQQQQPHTVQEGELGPYESFLQGDALDPRAIGQGYGHEHASSILALHWVCSHAVVREALIQACVESLDPESLLEHMVAVVKHSAGIESDEQEQEEANEKKSKNEAQEGEAKRIPPALPRQHSYSVAHLLFQLQLVATIVEGLVPTSLTSSSILEKAAELEMLLIGFAQNHLEAPEDAHPHTPQCHKDDFWEGGVLPRARLRRRLWLYTLYALYRCRKLTQACMQDLGMRNTMDYLAVVEETLWHATSRTGCVVGNWTIAELEERVRATTHMCHPPFAHAQALLVELALQRLTLARAVSYMLDREVACAKEARALATYVLRAIEPPLSHESAQPGELDAVAVRSCQRDCLMLANSFTDVQWLSLAHFSKQKRMRACLVPLIQVTFSLVHLGSDGGRVMEEESKEEGEGEGWAATPLWLKRCLRASGGIVVRAAIDVINAVSSEEILASIRSPPGQTEPNGAATGKVNANNKNPKERAEEANGSQTRAMHLPMMLRAMRYVYGTTGQMGYWPLLLSSALTWLQALFLDNTKPLERSNARERWPGKEEGDAPAPIQEARRVELIREVLEVVWCCLHYEPQAAEVLRRNLVDPRPVRVKGIGTEATETTTPTTKRGVSCTRSKGLSAAYVSAVGVFLTSSADLQRESTKSEGKNETADSDVVTSLLNYYCFEDEVGAVTQSLFSAGFAKGLLRCSHILCEFLEPSTAGEDKPKERLTTCATPHLPRSTSSPAVASTAMNILAHLYGIAMGAVLTMWRDHRVGTPKDGGLRQTTAGHFLRTVSNAMLEELPLAFSTPYSLPRHQDDVASTSEPAKGATQLAQWRAHAALGTFLEAMRAGDPSNPKATQILLVPNHLKEHLADDLERVWTGILQLHVSWLLDTIGDAPLSSRKKALQEKKSEKRKDTSLARAPPAGGDAGEAELLRAVCHGLVLLYENLHTSWSRRARPSLGPSAHRAATSRKGEETGAGNRRKGGRKTPRASENEPNEEDHQTDHHHHETEGEGEGEGETGNHRATETAQSLGEREVSVARSRNSSLTSASFACHLLSQNFFSTKVNCPSCGNTAEARAAAAVPLIQRLKAFFNPTHAVVSGGAAADADAEETTTPVRRFLNGAWRLFQQGRAPGMMGFWLLYAMQEAVAGVAGFFPASASAPVSAGAEAHAQRAAARAAVALASRCYDPTQSYEAAWSNSVKDSLATLLHACGSARKPTVMDFLPLARGQDSCTHPAVWSYYTDALEAIPPLLSVLHADRAPASLHIFLHALLRSAIPSPEGCPITAPPTSRVSDPSHADLFANRADEEEGQVSPIPAQDPFTAPPVLAVPSVEPRTRDSLPAFEKNAPIEDARYLLLLAAARAVLELRDVAGMRWTSLKPHLERLLWIGTLPELLAYRQRCLHKVLHEGPGALGWEREGMEFWVLLLELSAMPAEPFDQEDGFVSLVWAYVQDLLDELAEDATRNSNDDVSPEAAVWLAETTASHLRAALLLLTRTWLPRHVFWRQPVLLPPMLSTLLVAVLHTGRRCREAPWRESQLQLSHSSSSTPQTGEHARLSPSMWGQGLYNQLAALFQGLCQQLEGDSEASLAAAEGGMPAASALVAAAAAAPSSTPTAKGTLLTRRFALAAAVAAVFEVAARYTEVFAMYSRDLDYLFAAFVRVLVRHHLPQAKTSPLAFHEGVSIRPTGPSKQTLLDLVYTLIGHPDGKALLRQAVLRLREEEQAIGTGGDAERTELTEQRHIFNVN